MLKQVSAVAASVDSFTPNMNNKTATSTPIHTTATYLTFLGPQHSRNDTNTSLPATGPVLRHTRAISEHSQNMLHILTTYLA